jgi:hypothetical protein
MVVGRTRKRWKRGQIRKGFNIIDEDDDYDDDDDDDE